MSKDDDEKGRRRGCYGMDALALCRGLLTSLVQSIESCARGEPLVRVDWMRRLRGRNSCRRRKQVDAIDVHLGFSSERCENAKAVSQAVVAAAAAAAAT